MNLVGDENRMTRPAVEDEVISQFGEQWTRYRGNEGYYASLELLRDLLGPLAEDDEFHGKVVADIGSGTGRIVNMLAAAGAAKVVAVEPSEAIGPLRENTAHLGERVVCLHEKGDAWSHPGVDAVVSFGVLHHIPEPGPTVRNAYDNLRPGGTIHVWLYGKEGNELYLALVSPVRAVTPRLPTPVLSAFCWGLTVPLNAYVAACRWLPLPMRGYMREHLGKLDVRTRHLTVYDQLNPTWAKYYTRDEAERLLGDAGFTDVKTYRRHGYSWTVSGRKPE